MTCATRTDHASLRSVGVPGTLLFVTPFPFVVWGADELRRWLLRRRSSS